MIILENIYVSADGKKQLMPDTWVRESYPSPAAVEILYDLLGEREPYQNISHKAMPTFEEHCRFVESDPYKAWFLIMTPITHEEYQVVGTVYLTHKNEIGIQLLKEFIGQGHGSEAVYELSRRFKGPFYANINPENTPSVQFFEKLGAKHIQNTYIIE